MEHYKKISDSILEIYIIEAEKFLSTCTSMTKEKCSDKDSKYFKKIYEKQMKCLDDMKKMKIKVDDIIARCFYTPDHIMDLQDGIKILQESYKMIKKISKLQKMIKKLDNKLLNLSMK